MGDVMLFGVLEMPESMWKDDSPLDRAQRRSRYVQAAQRIRDQDEQLAAKDREIAELRRRRAEMSGRYQDALGEVQLQLSLRGQVEFERDEARECAARLQRRSQAVIDRWHSPQWEWRENGPTADLMNDLRDTLAATPEHLRNA